MSGIPKGVVPKGATPKGGVSRRLTRGAMLVSLALVLSLLERMIPLELLIPIPGIKLGLANIVTLFALVSLGMRDTVVILTLRIGILGLINGPVPFLLSAAGGLLALLVMWALLRGEGRLFSLIGVGMGGAVAHNSGQVLAASLLLGNPALLAAYLPALLLTGLATGMLTGSAAIPVCRILGGVKGATP
jgi:heptaprenyl diphosphate synthase